MIVALTALKTGRYIVVVPVLIEGATVIGLFTMEMFFLVDAGFICCVEEWDNSFTVEGECFTSWRNVVVAFRGNSETDVCEFNKLVFLKGENWLYKHMWYKL